MFNNASGALPVYDFPKLSALTMATGKVRQIRERFGIGALREFIRLHQKKELGLQKRLLTSTTRIGMDDGNHDLECLGRLRRGDEAALAELYDRFSRPIYSMVYRMLQNHADSEEIVQDVFVSLWKNAADFDQTRSSPFTWLVTIARNKAIDRIRRGRRRIPDSATGDRSDGPEPVEPSDDGASITMLNDRSELIRQWMQELPVTQREAVCLAFFGGLTHPEIASQLSESVGTIKSRIRLGVEKLRAKAERRQP